MIEATTNHEQYRELSVAASYTISSHANSPGLRSSGEGFGVEFRHGHIYF